MASRGKGQSSKVPAQSQTQVLPPVAPQVPSDLGLKVNQDLKKKRPAEIPEEGEVVPRPDKQQKTTRGQRSKRASSVESQEEENRAEVRVTPRTWSPKLELDGVAIPYTASVQEYNNVDGLIRGLRRVHHRKVPLKGQKKLGLGELPVGLHVP